MENFQLTLLIIGVVFILLIFLFMVYTLIKVIKNHHLQGSTMPLWVLIILLFPIVGSIIYLFYESKNKI